MTDATPMRVLAIDGPAASGKSSTGIGVARALGWTHLDTGALYRGLTLVALESGTLDDADAILATAKGRGLSLKLVGSEVVVYLDGRPAEGRIRTPEVSGAVSRVSAMPQIRAWATEQFRAAVRGVGPTVLDGRDIGTVVFPEAPLKIYLTAEPAARALRRLRQRGEEPTPGEVNTEARRLAARDTADAAREEAPLRPAADAVTVDTTGLTLSEQVARIVALARQRWLP